MAILNDKNNNPFSILSGLGIGLDDRLGAVAERTSQLLDLMDSRLDLKNLEITNASAFNKSKFDGGALARRMVASPLTANLTLKQVESICALSHAMGRSLKNIFLIEIREVKFPLAGLSVLNSIIPAGSQYKQIQNIVNTGVGFIQDKGHGGNIFKDKFNMLCTDISYSPISLENNQASIGSSMLELAKTAQLSEVSITTLDDPNGSVKSFFKALASKRVHSDGTVGLAGDGLVEITIYHNNVTKKGFSNQLKCYPLSLDLDLSRKDNGVEEFTMRFQQADSFMF